MEYVLKSMICLLVLLTIHRLWLQSEVFYRFNRFFLLGAVVFSFWIPSYTIQRVEMVEEKVVAEASADRMESEPIFALGSVSDQPVSPIVTSSEFPWETVMWSLYGLISLIFLIRFLRNISILYNQIQQNLRVTYRGQTLVLLSEQVVPFTFFHYIFVNRQEFEKEELSDAVLEHELAHVQGKHSWDILFIELLLVPFWFHPGLYWAKQSIQLNHEFIADQSALKKWPLHRYQQELLQFAAGKSANGLVSNLNFSLTKKRLEMMKKQSKPAIRAVKLLVLLPMIGLVIYGFSEKEYVLVEKNSGTEPKSIDQSNELNFYLNKDGGFTYEGKVYALKDLKDLLRDFDNTMLINLSVDPGLSMGKLADFQTELRKLDVRKIKYVSNSGIWPPRNERINDLTEYLNDLGAYNAKLETGVHFVKKSESEQEEIMKLFLDLGGRYFRLPIDDKRKAERPVHPYAPYVHLDKDGEVYYKLPKDLTEEEKAQLPPPPPPAQKGNGVTLLKVYRELYYTYELTRNNREHFIYKSKEEREAIFNQFKRVESAYFGLDHNDKMLVKRPTSPQTPYVVLVKDGKEFFKLASELTEEDRKMMGC